MSKKPVTPSDGQPAADQPPSVLPADTLAEQRRLWRNARQRKCYHQRKRGQGAKQPILTSRQERFIDEYLKVGAATEAARRAGYSIGGSGSRLLRKPHIARIIADNRAAAQRRTEVTMDRVIGELAKLAFADPRDLFTADGKLKPIHALDDASAASIAAMEVLVIASGPRSAAGRAAKAAQTTSAAKAAQTTDADGAVGEVGDLPLELRKIKRWDKTKALELLGRYLGLFKDRVELGVSQDLASAIEAARRRALGAAAPPVIDVDVSEMEAENAVSDNTAGRDVDG